MPTYCQSSALRFSLRSILLGFILIALALTAYLRIGSLDETESRGDIIVQALERYHAVHSQYPATLTELCPNYLKRIPPPAWGMRVWQYSRNSAGDFYLAVNEDKNTGDGNSLWFQYLGPVHGWQTGD